MNNENLTHRLTASEQRAGGVASGKARRQKKLLRECLEALLDKEYTTDAGSEVTGAELISTKLFKKAVDGDVRAFEVLRDTAGQKPADRVEFDAIPHETYERVAAALDASEWRDNGRIGKSEE